ncbi:glycosyltransferase family 39 protein [Candidatus Roizmanbacteria bacterium]|nr:glycosyltransferase family 39 protein [Candidatus Roizmanbacteria bacterium]
MSKKLALIFLFSFLIRLLALNQSLWLDEATTARVVQQFNYQEIISKFSPLDFHPPLYYLFMKLWTNIFGYSGIALRMPSVLFSLATGYIVYLMAGIWGMVFFLFNPLIVYYSQEARMYMMTTFFLTVSLYYFLYLCHPEFISGSRNKFGITKSNNLLLFNLFTILSFLTFYGSIFLIVPMVLYFFFTQRYKYFIVNTLNFILASLFLSPLLYHQVINAKVSLSNVTNWSLVLGKANIKNLLLIPVKFSIGRIDFYPKWLYYAISGLWTSFVLFVLFINLKLKIVLVYLLVFPLFLGFIISFFTPLLQYFRFIYLVPIVAILLSFSLSQKAKIQPSGLILVGGYLIFSLSYLLIPQFHREDWKSLVKSLPADKPIYMVSSSSDPVRYYNRHLKVNELKSLSSLSGLSREVIVIPYVADIHGVDYKKILNEKNYFLTGKKTFRGLTLEVYSK